MFFRASAPRSRAALLTAAALVTAASLALTGCGSDTEETGDEDAPQAITPENVEIPEDQIPVPSGESVTLVTNINEAESLPANQLRTSEEVWQDRYIVAESIRQLEEPDLCQAATLEFMDLAIEQTAPGVIAGMTYEQLVDENAASEELEIVLATEDYPEAPAEQVAAQAEMDTACRHAEDTVTATDQLPAEFAGAGAVIELEQVVISDFLTAQTARLITEDQAIVYQATYPPSVDIADLSDTHLADWGAEVAERIEAAYTISSAVTSG